MISSTKLIVIKGITSLNSFINVLLLFRSTNISSISYRQPLLNSTSIDLLVKQLIFCISPSFIVRLLKSEYLIQSLIRLSTKNHIFSKINYLLSILFVLYFLSSLSNILNSLSILVKLYFILPTLVQGRHMEHATAKSTCCCSIDNIFNVVGSNKTLSILDISINSRKNFLKGFLSTFRQHSLRKTAYKFSTESTFYSITNSLTSNSFPQRRLSTKDSFRYTRDSTEEKILAWRSSFYTVGIRILTPVTTRLLKRSLSSHKASSYFTYDSISNFFSSLSNSCILKFLSYFRLSRVLYNLFCSIFNSIGSIFTNTLSSNSLSKSTNNTSRNKSRSNICCYTTSSTSSPVSKGTKTVNIKHTFDSTSILLSFFHVSLVSFEAPVSKSIYSKKIASKTGCTIKRSLKSFKASINTFPKFPHLFLFRLSHLRI